MTLWQKIKNVLLGLVMIALSVVMVLDARTGFDIIAVIVSVGLFYLGIKSLIFYQTMARHMVGGRIQLYRGVILLDLGVFMMSLDSIPQAYIVLYLMGIHAFAGIVDLLRARESRHMDSPEWKSSLVYGIGNIAMAVLCIISGVILKSVHLVVYVYAAGLVYSGIARIINALKKTAIVYIQ